MHTNRLALAISHRRFSFVPRDRTLFRPNPVPGANQQPHVYTASPNDRYHPERKDHIRAIAEEASKRLPTSTPSIDNFPEILRAYAQLVMRYDDPFVVGDYFTMRLKQAIPEAERLRWRMRKTRWTKKALKVVLGDMRDHMKSIIKGLEPTLLALLEKGRPTKTTLPRGRAAIRTRVNEGCRRPCVVIIEDDSSGPFIVDLQSMGDYDRTQRHRIRTDRAYVRPCPGQRLKRRQHEAFR